jgi:hypothetical protein
VGPLTDKPEISAISRELGSAGADVAAVEILCGERGAAILDEHGRHHGLRGRVVRAFQWLGYDGTTLATYDEAPRDGDLLLQVPVRPKERRRIAELLQPTTFTMWATSDRAHSSSSPPSMGTDRHDRPAAGLLLPGRGTSRPELRAARTTRFQGYKSSPPAGGGWASRRGNR